MLYLSTPWFHLNGSWISFTWVPQDIMLLFINMYNNKDSAEWQAERSPVKYRKWCSLMYAECNTIKRNSQRINPCRQSVDPKRALNLNIILESFLIVHFTSSLDAISSVSDTVQAYILPGSLLSYRYLDKAWIWPLGNLYNTVLCPSFVYEYVNL